MATREPPSRGLSVLHSFLATLNLVWPNLPLLSLAPKVRLAIKQRPHFLDDAGGFQLRVS